jgi:hypothetical protein
VDGPNFQRQALEDAEGAFDLVNAELICHFFSETRCPLFSGLGCHLFASSVPIIRKAVWFGPRSGPFMRRRARGICCDG